MKYHTCVLSCNVILRSCCFIQTWSAQFCFFSQPQSAAAYTAIVALVLVQSILVSISVMQLVQGSGQNGGLEWATELERHHPQARIYFLLWIWPAAYSRRLCHLGCRGTVHLTQDKAGMTRTTALHNASDFDLPACLLRPKCLAQPCK